MASSTGKAFDFKLFGRLLEYTRAYRWTFYFVAIAAILLSFFAVLRPYLLQVTIDDSIVPQDNDQLLFYILVMTGVLLLEVIFQFCFIYFANWLGQEVIRDLRVNLFEHSISTIQRSEDWSPERLVTLRLLPVYSARAFL